MSNRPRRMIDGDNIFAVFTIKEDGKQKKTVAPMLWVELEKKTLWWPPSDVNIENKKKSLPNKETWRSCSLIKVDFEGPENICDEVFAYSSGSESERKKKATENISFTKSATSLPSKPPNSCLDILCNPKQTTSSSFVASKTVSPPICRRSRSSSPIKTSSSSKRKSPHRDYRTSENNRKRKSNSRSFTPTQKSKTKRRSSTPNRDRRHSSHRYSPIRRYSRSRSSSSYSRSSRSPHYKHSKNQKPRYRSHSKSSLSRSPHPRSPPTSQSFSSPKTSISDKSLTRKDSAHFLNQQFPMPEKEFQKLVLTLLLELKKNMPTAVERIEKLSNPIEVKKYDDLEEFKDFDDSLNDGATYNKFLSQLKKVGGAGASSNTKACMRRVMTNGLMSWYNMDGRFKKTDPYRKLAFGRTNVCKAIIAAVVSRHDKTESEVQTIIKMTLKNAPYQDGGQKTARKK